MDRPSAVCRLHEVGRALASTRPPLITKLEEVGRIALSQTDIVTDVLVLDDGVTVRISAQRQEEKDAGPAVLFTLASDLPQQDENASPSANSRRSDADFRLALDEALDGFMLFESVRDGSGQIVDFQWSYANSAAAKIIGKDPIWFEGRRLLVEMPGNRTDGLFDAYRSVVEQGIPWVQTFPYKHEGLDIFVRAVATKVNDGFAVMFADLSEQKACRGALHCHGGTFPARTSGRRRNRRLGLGHRERPRLRRRRVPPLLRHYRLRPRSGITGFSIY